MKLPRLIATLAVLPSLAGPLLAAEESHGSGASTLVVVGASAEGQKTRRPPASEAKFSAAPGRRARFTAIYEALHDPANGYFSRDANSGDTGGILNDDWTTVNATKFDYIKPSLAPMLGGAPVSKQPTKQSRP